MNMKGMGLDSLGTVQSRVRGYSLPPKEDLVKVRSLFGLPT